MKAKRTGLGILVIPILALLLLGILACGGADEEEESGEAMKAAAPKEAAPTAAPAAKTAPTAAPKTEAPKETMAEPTVAGTYENGMVKYTVPVTMPSSFNEAPTLAAKVKAGELPPVEDRLPKDPFVIPPVSIGKYGGTWNRLYTWAGDHSYVAADALIAWDGDGQTWIPRLAKNVEFSNGGRTLTITLREDHKFSDGDPFDAEDFKWTWEALQLNEEYTPVLSSQWKSPITKNAPTIEVVDSKTVQYTWDDPNYALVDRGLGSGLFSNRLRGLYSASHYLKQFHPDYGDKAKVDAAIAEAGVENWVELMKLKVNHYQNVDLPVLNAWKTIDPSEGEEWIQERNPYFYAVDTAGNQLPYLDKIHLVLVEDLETVALRAANGDVSFQGRHMTLAKVPLYRANAEQANTEMIFWECPCPSDAAININQSYNADPLIGELLRTRDFRKALSLGLNREEIKETFFLGMGQTRAYVPEPGSQYYPGDEYLQLNAVRDVAKANELLDGITLSKDVDPDGKGIKAKGADGIRLRPDNGEPLLLHTVTLGAYAVDYGPVAEMALRQWKEIGLTGTNTETRDAARNIQNNEEYMFVWETGGGQSPWVYPYWTIPWHQAFRSGVEVGRWYDTSGESGDAPDDPKYANPEGEFPLQKLIELYDRGKTFPIGSPERIEIGKEVYRIHANEVITLSTVGSTPLMKGTFVKKKNFMGVPENTVSGTGLHNQGPRPETYWIDEGQ